jgi:hypothetical protein
MIGWLLRKAAAPLALKALLIAVPLLLLSGGALTWYTVRLIEERGALQVRADAWQQSAQAWAATWEDERARQAATEAQRLARERERNTRRARFAATERDIHRLASDAPPVREYLDQQLPEALDAQLRAAEQGARP